MPDIQDQSPAHQLTIFASEKQIQERVREIAEQISSDFGALPIYVIGVLEDGFMFMADLVRVLEGQVICQFLKTYTTEQPRAGGSTEEIFFHPELEVAGQHVLLVQGVLQTGVTSEFLIRNLTSRGAASVRVATLIDRRAARRVQLNAEYSGFLLEAGYAVGYGLGKANFGRNLPYLALVGGSATPARGR